MTRFPPVNEQMDLIKKGVEEIIPEEELVKKLERSLKTGVPLRIKQGFDPTAPDIHLGHTVGIRKLKQFQDLGHTVVLIIGDYTGMVGDPSEKKETRPRLTHEQVIENARTYEKQFFKILNREKTEVRYNGEWFSKMTFSEVMDLAARFTVARILERDDFTQRMKEAKPISLHELFYPLMQGYDSVAIKADVEIGATEQKFNLLTARQVQKEYGVEEQVILTLPVLEGLDGVTRMSKSLGNYIGIDEEPQEMYGKIMSIPDRLIMKYFTLLTDKTPAELKAIEKRLQDPTVNPINIKHELAQTIVGLYHSQKATESAEEHFRKVFQKRELPDEIPEFQLSHSPSRNLLDILKAAGKIPSRAEGKRLIKQGAIKINGEKITNIEYQVPKTREIVVKIGKRRFLKIVP